MLEKVEDWKKAAAGIVLTLLVVTGFYQVQPMLYPSTGSGMDSDYSYWLQSNSNELWIIMNLSATTTQYYFYYNGTTNGSNATKVWGYDAGFDSSEGWSITSPFSNLTVNTAQSRLNMTKLARGSGIANSGPNYVTHVFSLDTFDFVIIEYDYSISAAASAVVSSGALLDTNGTCLLVNNGTNCVGGRFGGTSDATYVYAHAAGAQTTAAGASVVFNRVYSRRCTHYNSTNYTCQVWWDNQNKTGAPNESVSVTTNIPANSSNLTIFNLVANPIDATSTVTWIATGWLDNAHVRRYVASPPSIAYGAIENGDWEVSGENYTARRTINITSGSALTNYQMALDYLQFNNTNMFITNGPVANTTNGTIISVDPANETYWMYKNYTFVNLTAIGNANVTSCLLQYNNTNYTMDINGTGNVSCSYNITNATEGNQTFIAYFVTQSDGTLNYTLPYWWWKNSTFNNITAAFSNVVTRLKFTPTTLYSKQVAATNQTAVIGAYNLTNTTSWLYADTCISMRMNQSFNGFIMKCGNTSSYSLAQVINTTNGKILMYNQTQMYIWCWGDFYNPSAAGSYNVTLNVSGVAC